MAKIEFWQGEDTEQGTKSVETIEVRPWGVAGGRKQLFMIGSGFNFDCTSVIVLEIVHSVNGVQFFYTRNYLHQTVDLDIKSNWQNYFEKFRLGEADQCGFGDMLPETSIVLKRRKFSYQDENDQEKTSEIHHLEISADVGAVIGSESPGMRMLDINLDGISPEVGLKFMQDLAREIAEAQQGMRPNPADLPEGSSDWPFVRQLNRKAYDLISQDYDEKYFANPSLSGMFDEWLDGVPNGGHILDAGCGHGEPVIARLLERGYRVTGADLSPEMLTRAKERFPGASFVNQMVSEIRYEAEFEGACSLSSLLYLDPIDLSHGIYRLHRALKPGGLLFLFANDIHPDWRGEPYGQQLHHWMWSWSYGIEESTRALEEFGYFKVLKAQDVTTEEDRDERIARRRKSNQEEIEKMIQSIPTDLKIPLPKLPELPSNPSYCYAILARREVV